MTHSPQSGRDTFTWKNIFLVGLGMMAVAGVFLYRRNLGFPAFHRLEHVFFPCQVPIAYSVAGLDERFDLSRADFLSAIQEAEANWEEPLGLDLFAEGENGELTFSLVYDERQQTTEQLQKMGIVIDETKAGYADLKSEYDRIYPEYTSKKTILDRDLANFNRASANYESAVTDSNAEGGASGEEYERLQAERARLNQTATQINAQVLEVNSLAENVNALANSLNDLADKLNIVADTYNTIGDQLGDNFVEGTFGASSLGNSITIYQFQDHAKLVRVLQHEMGHALGLEHVDDPEAIMYWLNEGGGASPNETDLAALKQLCRLD